MYKDFEVYIKELIENKSSNYYEFFNSKKNIDKDNEFIYNRVAHIIEEEFKRHIKNGDIEDERIPKPIELNKKINQMLLPAIKNYAERQFESSRRYESTVEVEKNIQEREFEMLKKYENILGIIFVMYNNYYNRKYLRSLDTIIKELKINVDMPKYKEWLNEYLYHIRHDVKLEAAKKTLYVKANKYFSDMNKDDRMLIIHMLENIMIKIDNFLKDKGAL